MPEHDPRLDLPGSASPPIDGSRWLWVKFAAWGGAIALLLCAAAVVTMGVSSLLKRDRGEPASPQPVVVESVEASAPVSMDASPPPKPQAEPPPVQPLYVPAPPEQIVPSTPVAPNDDTTSKRLRRMQH